MNIARLLYPVQVLGPGKRIGIWFCGCHRRCKGCSNPELWYENVRYEISADDVITLIDRIVGERAVDGFTITGGEPFDQAHALSVLIGKLLPINRDILIYSGYTLAELQKSGDPDVRFILDHTAVLIDGVYMEERNTDVPMRGSDNQIIHVLNDRYRALYDHYLQNANNQIQNFVGENDVFSVGIHAPDFQRKIQPLLQSRIGGTDNE